jgi:hypothetical protein|eukprot:SAG31_NODE_6334_length_2061_cov_9.627315_4_plen_78_part_00
MSEMISLYDYTGYPDRNERGQKVNAYAQLRKQPYEKRTLDFNGIEVFLYTKEFLDEYFKLEKIFEPKEYSKPDDLPF